MTKPDAISATFCATYEVRKRNPMEKQHISFKERQKASKKAIHGIHSEIYKCKYAFTEMTKIQQIALLSLLDGPSMLGHLANV